MIQKNKKDTLDRIQPCTFGDKIGCKCSILDRTICTEFQKSRCTFYVTKEDYINNQLKAKEILKRKNLSVITDNKIVRAVDIGEIT